MKGFHYLCSLFVVVSILMFSTVLNAEKGNGGDTYLAFAEKMPAPDGGLKAIYKNVTYPRLALDAKVEGKVYVLAFINESGSVDDVKVIKGIGAGCDEAATDAIKKAKFSPGINKGQPVKVKLSLAIVFKL